MIEKKHWLKNAILFEVKLRNYSILASILHFSVASQFVFELLSLPPILLNFEKVSKSHIK